MIETIGSILLALCGLPETIRTIKNKRCDIGYIMLFSWLGGELCLTIFAINCEQYILLINYLTNIFFISIMLAYKER